MKNETWIWAMISLSFLLICLLALQAHVHAQESNIYFEVASDFEPLPYAPIDAPLTLEGFGLEPSPFLPPIQAHDDILILPEPGTLESEDGYLIWSEISPQPPE
jgi:hypothetical protein